MKISKKLKIGFLALAGLTALTGCGGTTTSSDSGNPEPEGEIKINITDEEISSFNGMTLSFWSPIVGPDAGYFQNLITTWNDKFGSKIKINSDPIEEESHYSRIISSLTNDDMPDLVMIHKSRIARFQRTGKMRDMTSILEQAGIDKSQYFDETWDAGVFDGEMYGLSIDMFPTLLFYNKKLIPEGYTEADILSDDFTYEKMCEMMAKAYVHNSVLAKRKYGFAFNYGYCEKPYIGNVYGIGGEPVDEENPTEPLYNDAKSFRAIKAIESIPFTFNEEGNKVASPSGSDHRKVFNTGRALFTMDGLYSAASLVRHNDTLDTGITFLPKVDSTGKKVAYCDEHMFATFNNKNVSTERDSAIALFIKYFVYNSVYWCQGGKVAARKDTAEDSTYKTLEWSFVTDKADAIVTPGKIYSFQTITSKAAETISKICEGKGTDSERYTDAEIQDMLNSSVDEARNLIKNL